ncbi:chromosome partitioning protein, ParB family [Rhizobiales bacterium GAS191]|nr:chromosome partitioning protein, ParB family [Rhizobiales bacterium GAS191]
MGRSLGQIAGAAEQARALIAAGETVVELDPESIDNSFVTDRLERGGSDHRELVELIRERGQQVPILVRPHPEKPGRYQVAYGHRRVTALAELGKRVRAIVRNLSDEDLVVAQGQENSARTDLSYIERGLFAVSLEERGFDRTVIMSALNMEKTQLSRLISIASAIPRELAIAIGPAPKAGRPRWTALVQRLPERDLHSELGSLLADATFRESDSDQRFVRVFNALAPKKARKSARPTLWRSPDGRKVAAIARAGQRVTITIDQKHTPEFGEFLIAQLPEIYAAFGRRADE